MHFTATDEGWRARVFYEWHSDASGATLSLRTTEVTTEVAASRMQRYRLTPLRATERPALW
jgi:hypothetical protein